MAYNDYNRYELLTTNNNNIVNVMPFVKIPINTTDKYEEYIEGIDRLDLFSNKYYANPTYVWLILLANPQYNSEFEIKSGDIIRIPFPLASSVADFESGLKSIINK